MVVERLDRLIAALEILHTDLGETQTRLDMLTDIMEEVREEVKWIIDNREEFTDWLVHHESEPESVEASDDTKSETTSAEQTTPTMEVIGEVALPATTLVQIPDISGLTTSDIRTIRSDFENANRQSDTEQVKYPGSINAGKKSADGKRHARLESQGFIRALDDAEGGGFTYTERARLVAATIDFPAGMHPAEKQAPTEANVYGTVFMKGSSIDGRPWTANEKILEFRDVADRPEFGRLKKQFGFAPGYEMESMPPDPVEVRPIVFRDDECFPKTIVRSDDGTVLRAVEPKYLAYLRKQFGEDLRLFASRQPQFQKGIAVKLGDETVGLVMGVHLAQADITLYGTPTTQSALEKSGPAITQSEPAKSNGTARAELLSTDAPHFFVIETPRKGKSPKAFLAKVAGDATNWDEKPKAAITFGSYKEASEFLGTHRSALPKASVGLVLRHALE